MKRWRMAVIAAWCAVLAAAFVLDRPIATWVHGHLGARLKAQHPRLLWAVRRGGDFRSFTLVAAGCLLIRGRQWRKPAAFVFVSGLLVAGNTVVKWVVGRTRPFQGAMFNIHPFVGGFRGIGGANQSFPSGDVCLAAATGISLGILFPRWRALWAVVIILVAIERVAEGAHFPSDAVAAIGLGWTFSYIAWRLLDRPGVGPGVAPAGGVVEQEAEQQG